MHVNQVLYQGLEILFSGLYFALFARILLSWIPHNSYHPLIQFLYRLTDPILRPFQNLIPSAKIGIDLSLIFAFIALRIIKRVLYQLIF